MQSEDEKVVEKEVLTLDAERSQKAIEINRQFSIETARIKFHKHYEKIQTENVEYLKI